MRRPTRSRRAPATPSSRRRSSADGMRSSIGSIRTSDPTGPTISMWILATAPLPALARAVVRKEQEHYMKLAWEQVGEIIPANRKAAFLRFSQAAMHKSFARNVEPLPAGAGACRYCADVRPRARIAADAPRTCQ